MHRWEVQGHRGLLPGRPAQVRLLRPGPPRLPGHPGCSLPSPRPAISEISAARGRGWVQHILTQWFHFLTPRFFLFPQMLLRASRLEANFSKTLTLGPLLLPLLEVRE